jgi:beta-N-acetylhexosaminidase
MPVDDELRRLALAPLLLGFTGPTPPPWLLDALADGLGGVVLFGANLGDGTRVAELTAALCRAAGRDIVVATDEEGGDVTRLDTARGSASPGAAALGHLDDVSTTEQVYATIGARLAAAGVTVDFAPVADVNLDPRNPVIGVRSFGADAPRVARHVSAAVRGLQGQGVGACVKHFPGHGATRTDSHHEVATLERDAAQLNEVELVPFAAAIGAGTRAVMTGHLLAPALDEHNLATVSAPITTDLLRGRLEFRGTVVTDALEMRALAGTLGLAGGYVAALAAGADAVETGALDYPRFVAAVPDIVRRALDEGSLSLDRLQDAGARTAALAAPPQAVPIDAPDVAGRCIEVIGQLPRLDRPLVVEARPPAGMASGELPWSLAEPLRDRIPDVQLMTVCGQDDPAHLSIDRASVVVVVVRDPQRHTWQRALLAAAAEHRNAVVVDVGWPTDLPAGMPAIRTRGIAPGLLAAAADALATGPAAG